MEDPVAGLSIKATLHEILRTLRSSEAIQQESLRTLQRIERNTEKPGDCDLLLVAAAIRKNTDALSTLSSNPPEIGEILT